MGGGADSQRAQTTHPDAPATESGRAYFRDANSFLEEDNPAGTLRHARSPAGRLILAQAPMPSNTGSQVQGSRRNPPPATQPLNEVLVRTDTAEVNFLIRVIVRADRTRASNVPVRSARTRISPSGGVARYEGMGLRVDGAGVVVGLSRKLIIRGAYTIRTAYGRRARATQDSLYGRGTTSQDKANGDVTLGFHEWCHQQDYLSYLRTTAFPEFTGRIGMPQDEFLEAAEQFNSDFDTFRDDLLALGDAVDEVGYTKSQCVADGRCR